MFGEALVVQHLSFATSELVSDLLFFALLCRFPPLLCFCFKSALATAALLSALIPQSPSLPLNSLAFGEGSIDCPWIETRPLKESESGETLSAATYEEKKANKEVSKYDEKKAKKEGEFKWDYDYVIRICRIQLLKYIVAIFVKFVGLNFDLLKYNIISRI
ncbi:hypothetical protein Ahy_B06g083485 isoform E [Arachis hypogaea]|uniref:Uncharacterized protein n=1 Tax=Arachis hypogaea TaxID=3818 RepID=A0A444YPW1_ARAHY|nr:hypothetical protein Ahy_B06g083485 isoform E [Arachis hypogaea]